LSQAQKDREKAAKDLQDSSQADRDQAREDWQDYGVERREDWQEYGDDHWEEHGPWAAYGWSYYDDDWMAFAAGAAIGVGVAVTAAAVESPQAPCTMTPVAGQAGYYQCGPNWYQRAYQGGELVYIVVTPPAGH
jgi:hypothetical protein